MVGESCVVPKFRPGVSAFVKPACFADCACFGIAIILLSKEMESGGGGFGEEGGGVIGKAQGCAEADEFLAVHLKELAWDQ